MGRTPTWVEHRRCRKMKTDGHTPTVLEKENHNGEMYSYLSLTAIKNGRTHSDRSMHIRKLQHSNLCDRTSSYPQSERCSKLMPKTMHSPAVLRSQR